VFVAGDLFDKARDHNALDLYLNVEFGERLYAVKGQHDMVSHNEVEKSAFDNAVSAGRIQHLTEKCDYSECAYSSYHLLDSRVVVQGCGWGEKIPKPHEGAINILVIHRTYWSGTPIQPGQKDGNADILFKTELKGFDRVFSGDNHTPFIISDDTSDKRRVMINCGAICRRNILQKNIRPCVYILHDDLSVVPHYLETTEIWLTEQQEERQRHVDAGAKFVDALKGGGFKSKDTFLDLIKQEAESKAEPVRHLLLDAVAHATEKRAS
jgi:hypothetical protein